MRIEVHHRVRIFHDRALQHQGRTRFEPKKKLPDRPDQEALEEKTSGHRGERDQRLGEEGVGQEAGGAQADEETEEQAGREERENVRESPARVLTVMVARGMTAMVAGVAVTMTNVSGVTIPAMVRVIAPVVAEAKHRHHDQTGDTEGEKKGVGAHGEEERYRLAGKTGERWGSLGKNREGPGLSPSSPVFPSLPPFPYILPMPFLNLHEAEILAREILPAPTYDYFAGGANDEITLHANRQAFDALAIRYRVLVDVSRRDLSVRLLGAHVPAPLVVAPMAFQRLAHADGELGTARAAGALGLPMTLSTFSTVALEEVRAATSGPLWFQLYVHQDRSITRALVERVAAAGYSALVLTVDVPEIGRRERDTRNAFRLSPALRVAHFPPDASIPLQHAADESGLANFIHGMRDASLSWKDLEWLASLSPLPLVIKGLVRADDARRAVDHGVAGVVVSNHGGRQLDTAIPSLRALPDVADAVGDSILVMMDGGIRRGTDVIKALALGAQAVMVGRPLLWALALEGEEGVRRALTLLVSELDLAMALAGAPRLSDITRDLLE